MGKKRKALSPNEPLLGQIDHSRPVTRREFLARGIYTGSGLVAGSSLLGLLTRSGLAHADLSDLSAELAACNLSAGGSSPWIPFICFDLAGGVSVAGSNVLVGGQGGPLDLLSTAGYSKLGLPGDMIPGAVDPAGGDFTDNTLGLYFHSDSGFLRGILERSSAGTQSLINGAVIPARSDNDTGNNPHNPMYGIAKVGRDGELARLIGSRASESGGNSMAPPLLINPEWRPTKVDRPTDVTGLVDTGDLLKVLNKPDAVEVMKAVYQISDAKMNSVSINHNEAAIRELVSCAYLKAAWIAENFADPADIDPLEDPRIVGGTDQGTGETFPPIFTEAELAGDGEFRKTVSVMKMVISGLAGAGTITMGGYDYHTGERGTGERRDLRAGRCMGACLEYAARVGTPLMLYVFSDGSVASNGRIDDSVDGRGKGEWTGDNSSTAGSFFLVYNPSGRPIVRNPQIGWMRPDASVETSATPMANQVNLLVDSVILNYLALHDRVGDFDTKIGNRLGSLDRFIAFEPIT